MASYGGIITTIFNAEYQLVNNLTLLQALECELVTILGTKKYVIHMRQKTVFH